MGNHLCACFGVDPAREQIRRKNANTPKTVSEKTHNVTLDQVADSLAAEDVGEADYGTGAVNSPHDDTAAGGVLSPSPELFDNEEGAGAILGDFKNWLEQAKLAGAQTGGGTGDSAVLENSASTPQTSAGVEPQGKRRLSGDAELLALLQRVDAACARLTATPVASPDAPSSSTAGANTIASGADTNITSGAQENAAQAALPPRKALFSADADGVPKEQGGASPVFSSPARAAAVSRDLLDSPRQHCSSPASSTRSGSTAGSSARKKFNLV